MEVVELQGAEAAPGGLPRAVRNFDLYHSKSSSDGDQKAKKSQERMRDRARRHASQCLMRRFRPSHFTQQHRFHRCPRKIRRIGGLRRVAASLSEAGSPEESIKENDYEP
jgi:hypothetical protein